MAVSKQQAGSLCAVSSAILKQKFTEQQENRFGDEKNGEREAKPSRSIAFKG